MVSERTNLSLVKKGVEGPLKPLSFSDWQRFPSDIVECEEYDVNVVKRRHVFILF